MAQYSHGRHVAVQRRADLVNVAPALEKIWFAGHQGLLDRRARGGQVPASHLW